MWLAHISASALQCCSESDTNVAPRPTLRFAELLGWESSRLEGGGGDGAGPLRWGLAMRKHGARVGDWGNFQFTEVEFRSKFNIDPFLSHNATVSCRGCPPCPRSSLSFTRPVLSCLDALSRNLPFVRCTRPRARTARGNEVVRQSLPMRILMTSRSSCQRAITCPPCGHRPNSI